jgi:hypothetical protein
MKRILIAVQSEILSLIAVHELRIARATLRWQAEPCSHVLEAQLTVEKISAVTLRVANMRTSVRFYRDVLGLEIIYGGEDADFSSLRTKEGKDPILNLERSDPVLGQFMQNCPT